MKVLMAIALVISSLSAMADCEILKPGRSDNNSRYCPGTSYGLTYNGYLTSDACYTTLKEALLAKKNMSACEKSSSLGNCEILLSGRSDKNSRYCSGVSFGVTYKGYFAEDTCHTSIDKAMAAMEQIKSCHKSSTRGDLSILFPGKSDNNDRYCPGMSFSVLYDGYLIEDACYTTIDKAMSVMENF